MRTRRSWLQRLTSYFVMEDVRPDGTRVITALDPTGFLQPGPWFVVNIYDPPTNAEWSRGTIAPVDATSVRPVEVADDLVA